MNTPTQSTGKVRALIADDSPIFAEALREILESDDEICVVGTASDGQRAVQLTERLRPDIITMDIEMPVMDGLQAIEQIMTTVPTPILVVTGDLRADRGELSFEALRRGALDLVLKPESWSLPADRRRELVDHVKLLAGVMVIKHPSRDYLRLDRPLQQPAPAVAGPLPGRVVGMVTSTGGPATLAQILARLPARFPAPVLIVQHIASGFAASLASWLDDVSPLSVRLARHDDLPRPGHVYLAPERRHMTVDRLGRIRLDAEPRVDGYRPSGTRLLGSMAAAYGERVVGVILTGMGRDGVEGLQRIREAGGVTVAQDEETSVVYGMPRSARECGAARLILPLPEIPGALCRLVESRSALPTARTRAAL